MQLASAQDRRPIDALSARAAQLQRVRVATLILRRVAASIAHPPFPALAGKSHLIGFTEAASEDVVTDIRPNYVLELPIGLQMHSWGCVKKLRAKTKPPLHRLPGQRFL